jgi:hypothetical protein
MAPGRAWPVVDPGGLPAGTLVDEPAEDAPVPPAAPPPALPPAPAACASEIEVVSASAPANIMVANFMGHFPSPVVMGQTGRRD